MGQLRFRLPPKFQGEPTLRLAYVTGQDRSPARAEVAVRDGILIVKRDAPESGRLHVPWPVEGFGRPIVSTATLAERPEPYNLAVELARGKLNDVRNQFADWQQMGLSVSPAFAAELDGARRGFARAATSQDQPEIAAEAAAATLVHTFAAGRTLAESYTKQVLRRRLEQAPKLPTLLGCGLGPQPKAQTWGASISEVFNAGRIRCTWAEMMPDEGKPRLDETDSQFQFCRKRHLTITAGPLIDFRPGAFPDWLWLWQGDFDQILQEAVTFVRQVVGRYRGKIAVWHLVARPASSEVLGLSEEEQIRLTARIIQVARALDPDAILVVDLDRPWAEWLASSSSFQLGPLHLADSLARADLGLGGVGLEVAPGFAPLGSHLRDLFEFSRLLDLYALINLPIHVGLAMPSSAESDPRAEESNRVEIDQWPRPPDEELQRDWAARWVALAAAKPFVRSVTWLQPTDASRHLYPHAGLFRPDGSPKPVLDWFRQFRREAFG